MNFSAPIADNSIGTLLVGQKHNEIGLAHRGVKRGNRVKTESPFLNRVWEREEGGSHKVVARFSQWMAELLQRRWQSRGSQSLPPQRSFARPRQVRHHQGRERKLTFKLSCVPSWTK